MTPLDQCLADLRELFRLKDAGTPAAEDHPVRLRLRENYIRLGNADTKVYSLAVDRMHAERERLDPPA